MVDGGVEPVCDWESKIVCVQFAVKTGIDGENATDDILRGGTKQQTQNNTEQTAISANKTRLDLQQPRAQWLCVSLLHSKAIRLKLVAPYEQRHQDSRDGGEGAQHVAKDNLECNHPGACEKGPRVGEGQLIGLPSPPPAPETSGKTSGKTLGVPSAPRDTPPSGKPKSANMALLSIRREKIQNMAKMLACWITNIFATWLWCQCPSSAKM